MKFSFKVPQLFGVILLFATICFAQDAVVTKVDDFIKNEMQKQKIPGVSSTETFISLEESFKRTLKIID